MENLCVGNNILSLPKDRRGFINLCDEELYKGYKNFRIYLKDENGFGYYFKTTGKNAFDTTLANGDYKLLSEVVIGKFYQKLGLNAVQYYLARYDDLYGVISRDFEQGENNKLFSHYLRNGFNLDLSLSEIKDNGIFKYAPAIAKKRLDKVSLAHILAGNNDGHVANIGVKLKHGVPNDFILFDNGGNYAFKNDLKNLNWNYIEKEGSDIKVTMGINKSRGSLYDYISEIKTSNTISSNSIKEFLITVNNVLKNDKCFLDIEHEVREEYNLPLQKEFINRVKFIANQTTNMLNEAYEERLHNLGDE